ncbi:Ran-binding protein 6 [Vitis vinifera]|uniref:Ran-binding protein 6 n=1 Tax=Vitis vinifera TaxID=29760 RepID=A0A438EGY7_VITVI|nr:Ran-binding protein 6 [Vitis vinifera]
MRVKIKRPKREELPFVYLMMLLSNVENQLLNTMILTFLSYWKPANDENPHVRQAAVYGIGVCAEFGGSAFKPLVGEALSRLDVVIRHSNARDSDNVMAYDNAVSALGKICQFHPDSIDAVQVCAPTFPPAIVFFLTRDLIEAKVVHDQLCSMVERSDRELLGPNNQYLPKIVAVFAEFPTISSRAFTSKFQHQFFQFNSYESYCAGKDLATEETTSRMINLLRQLRQTLSPLCPGINVVILAASSNSSRCSPSYLLS